VDLDLSEASAPPVAEHEPWLFYHPATRWLFLSILFLVALCSLVDRYLMSVLLEPIRIEFGASDTVMGALTGFAFAAFYGLLGIPFARWADRGDRRLIIAVAVGLWSVMSALCGLAKSLPMLAAARVGVGVGEAGGSPPTMSLVADYFPPSQRGRAVSILILANLVGGVIAFVIGTRAAATFGWRSAFLWLSLPGVPLAILAFLVLDEPRRRSRRIVMVATESIGRAAKALMQKRSLVCTLAGGTIYVLVVTGAGLWVPAYIQRVLRIDLAKWGALYGLVSTLVPIVGMSLGGWVIDRLTKRSTKWLAWLPALGIAISLPCYEMRFLSQSFEGFLIWSTLGELSLAMTVPAYPTLILTVAGAHRRSFAFALYGLLSTLFGMGCGPLIAGVLSDRLAPHFGVDGLRYALMTVTGSLALAALLFVVAARSVENDVEG
jgi:MFS family permease